MAIKRFKFDKLVRDKSLERMEGKGAFPVIKKSLSADELISYFKAKIAEEAQEVGAAKTDKEMLEELADCADVIDGFIRVLGFTTKDLECVRKEKGELRGKFESGLVIESVSADEDSWVARYCKKEPERYPEIEE